MPHAAGSGKDGAASVPACVAEITPAWLDSALRSDFPAARLRGLTPTRIRADHGFASEIYRLALDGDQVPPAVVVKLWHRETAGGLREVLFFQQFAPAAGPLVARCHCARADDASGRGVLVLEDLSQAVQGDCLDFTPAPRALALAEALATLHARWWQLPAQGEIDSLPAAPSTDRAADWFADRRAVFLQRYPDSLQGSARHLLDRIEPRVALAYRRLEGSRSTLLHRDLHLDNVLFDRVTDRPVILDWALIARGSPALDLAAVVFELADLHDTDAVTDHYLATLRRQRCRDFDAPGLPALLGAAMLLRFAAATCGVARWQAPSARGTAIVAVGIERATRAVQHWQSLDPELFAV